MSSRRRRAAGTRPVFLNSANYAAGAVATSHSINLPAGISAGNLLVALIGHAGLDSLSAMSGWTIHGTASGGTAGSNRRLTLAYKIATGSEGATAGLTMDNSCTIAAQVYLISGGTFAGWATATGNAANANPPNLDLTMPADTVWIAAASLRGSYTSGPSGYTATTTAYSSADGDKRIASSWLESALSSQDPGAFTSGTDQFATATIGVR